MALSQDKAELLRQVKKSGTVNGHSLKTIDSAIASGFIKEAGSFFRLTQMGEEKLSER